jgi:SAM-dependent methyltransferase
MTALTLDSDAARAYAVLAPAYDLLTADYAYEPWLDALERLALRHGLAGRRLLDVACGTGKSFLPMLARGYEVTACDISPAMLEIAAGKAGGRARLEVHDMRALPVLGAFDLVTCLDDAINYLHDAQELVAAFAGLVRNLAPEGIAVFDVNSLSAYEAFFGALSVVPERDRVLVWRGGCTAPLAPGSIAAATVESLRRNGDGSWTARTHEHRQRHHAAPLLEAALAATGLAVRRVAGMHTDGSITAGFDETSNSKALYVVARA